MSQIHQNNLLFVEIIAGVALLGIIFFTLRATIEYLDIPDQSIRDTIRIRTAIMSRGGYIVITGLRYKSPENRDYLITDYFAPGIYRNIRIPYFIEAPNEPGHTFAPIEPQRPGSYFTATLYNTPEQTTPVRDILNRVVQKKFRGILANDFVAEKEKCDREGDISARRVCIENIMNRFADNQSFLFDFCQVVGVEDKQFCFQKIGSLLVRSGITRKVHDSLCQRSGKPTYYQWCMSVYE